MHRAAIIIHKIATNILNLKLRNNLEMRIKCSLDSDIKVTSDYYTKKYADTVIVIATKV